MQISCKTSRASVIVAMAFDAFSNSAEAALECQLLALKGLN
jgi:hypothetical protein